MSKGKKIYFLVLLLITILVTTFYFSYAIFSNTKEEHGKLNIVAGTLNYKIESSELDSDSITLEANTSKEIKIKLTSLNEVSSKYELYYILDESNNNVSVGYSKDTKDSVLGTVEANKNKIITIVIRNDSDTSSKVTFKVLGGLLNNDLTLKDGNSLNKELALCSYEKGYVWNFDYTGGEQEFTTPCSGNYKIELWGASGGTYNDTYHGGLGGYAAGNINLSKKELLYVYVGQANNCVEGSSGYTNGGYNGGGEAGSTVWENRYFCGGGGATDIRLLNGIWNDFSSLKSRIMVAAGGGGANYLGSSYHATGGAGGGLIGIKSSGNTGTAGGDNPYKSLGGTQTSGNSFGYGGYETTNGGGSGYYGGIAGVWAGGAGGSSYISGHNGCDAISESSTEENIVHTGQSIHYSGYKFINTIMVDGEGYNWTSAKENFTGMPSYLGSYTITGNDNNGYARITYLGN